MIRLDLVTPAPDEIREIEAVWNAIAASLREWDTCWPSGRSALVLLPQTDVDGAWATLKRMFTMLSRAGAQARARSATFPDDAPTADGLLAELSDSVGEIWE